MLEYLKTKGPVNNIVNYGTNTLHLYNIESSNLNYITELLLARTHVYDWFKYVKEQRSQLGFVNIPEIGICKRDFHTYVNKKFKSAQLVYIFDYFDSDQNNQKPRQLIIFPICDPYELDKSDILFYRVLDKFFLPNIERPYIIKLNTLLLSPRQNKRKTIDIEYTSRSSSCYLCGKKKHKINNQFYICYQCTSIYSTFMWKYLCFAIFAIKELIMRDLRPIMYEFLIS